MRNSCLCCLVVCQQLDFNNAKQHDTTRKYHTGPGRSHLYLCIAGLIRLRRPLTFLRSDRCNALICDKSRSFGYIMVCRASTTISCAICDTACREMDGMAPVCCAVEAAAAIASADENPNGSVVEGAEDLSMSHSLTAFLNVGELSNRLL